MIARGAFALALLGPPLIGIAVPLTSGVLLRRLSSRRSLSEVRRSVRPAAIAGALVLWVAISVAMAVVLIRIAAASAMGWADSGNAVPTGEEVELLTIVSAGLSLLIACGIVLHSFLIRTCKPISATAGSVN